MLIRAYKDGCNIFVTVNKNEQENKWYIENVNIHPANTKGNTLDRNLDFNGLILEITVNKLKELLVKNEVSVEFKENDIIDKALEKTICFNNK